VRSDCPGSRIARLLFCLVDGKIVVLHGFIKKTNSPAPSATLNELTSRVENIVSPGRRIFPQAVAKMPLRGPGLIAGPHPLGFSPRKLSAGDGLDRSCYSARTVQPGKATTVKEMGPAQ
jgi:hypothetical protein